MIFPRLIVRHLFGDNVMDNIINIEVVYYVADVKAILNCVARCYANVADGIATEAVVEPLVMNHKG